ncbi:hypothetical protein HMN09_00790900 [Mycena chlorophos]|uniref:Uncharacterized protein n=1 Tax=Mycena chlorophos TaxID=658473 RepID=A0A8H6W752_MYCCL|nr:hypothetical protein HMN09_00790900 [Mycena chlorophos]
MSVGAAAGEAQLWVDERANTIQEFRLVRSTLRSSDSNLVALHVSGPPKLHPSGRVCSGPGTVSNVEVIVGLQRTGGSPVNPSCLCSVTISLHPILASRPQRAAPPSLPPIASAPPDVLIAGDDDEQHAAHASGSVDLRICGSSSPRSTVTRSSRSTATASQLISVIMVKISTHTSIPALCRASSVSSLPSTSIKIPSTGRALTRFGYRHPDRCTSRHAAALPVFRYFVVAAINNNAAVPAGLSAHSFHLLIYLLL